jgi:hypothetical protein
MTPTRTSRARLPFTLATGLLATAALSFAPTVQAGPTVAADMDLGACVGQGITSYTRGLAPTTGPVPGPAALYVAGFRIRAGWRFDIGPVWILPELGGGYDAERFQTGPTTQSYPLPRAFGGARAGLSLPLAAALRLEPAVYGHVGYAHYWLGGESDDGLANDVGLSLDLRFLKYFIVGAQVGYEVVTLWQPVRSSPSSTPPTGGCMTAFGTPVPCSQPPTGAGASAATSVATADKWIGYGIHAGVLFW